MTSELEEDGERAGLLLDREGRRESAGTPEDFFSDVERSPAEGTDLVRERLSDEKQVSDPISVVRMACCPLCAL